MGLLYYITENKSIQNHPDIAMVGGEKENYFLFVGWGPLKEYGKK